MDGHREPLWRLVDWRLTFGAATVASFAAAVFSLFVPGRSQLGAALLAAAVTGIVVGSASAVIGRAGHDPEA